LKRGDLTGWNYRGCHYFEVLADAKLEGAYGLHVKDGRVEQRRFRYDRFAVTPGIPYRFSCKTKEYGYKDQTDAIVSSADVSIALDIEYNYGGISNLFVGSTGSNPADTRRTLLKFDLSDYGIHHILTSAKIKLSHHSEIRYAINNRIMRVFCMLRDWVEGTQKGLPGYDPDGATWDTYDGVNAWGTAGAANTSTDREASDIGNVTVLASDITSTVEIALDTSKIDEIKNGVVENFGFQVKMDTESNDQHVFYARSASDISKRPTLELAYKTPSDYVIRIDFYDSEEDGTIIDSVSLCAEANHAEELSIDRLFTPPTGASYAELVIEASQGVGFYVDSISVESFKSIHFTDKGVSVEGNFLVNGSSKTVTDRFYNKSGVSVVEGDAVILDSANDRAFKATTTAGSFAALGVAKETIVSDALGALATTAGEVALVNCDTTAVAIGDYLKTSSTVKLATSNGKIMTPNCFAKALSAKASGSVGTVYCMILDHNPVAATPAEINNLVLWLRPESLSAYAEGALLAQWTDESVSANHPVQASDSLKPVIRKSAINGLDVVEFNRDRLQTPVSVLSGATARTSFIVYKNLNSANEHDIFGASNSGTARTAWVHRSLSANDPHIMLEDYIVSSNQAAGSTPLIASADYDGATVRILKNGSVYNSATHTLNTGTAGWWVGCLWNGSSYYYSNVQIAEIIVYKRCLTAAERGAVHEYLSNKYGITLS
jgi:hypothetical protein